jgi:hypothetical protein
MTHDVTHLLGTIIETMLENIAGRSGGRVVSRPFPLGSGQFNGDLTSNSKTLTSMSPSRIRVASWPSTRRGLGRRSNEGCHDSVLAHYPRARCAAMALTSSSPLHRRLGRLQPPVCRKLSISFRQTDTTLGPQVHQAPKRRDPPLVLEAFSKH